MKGRIVFVTASARAQWLFLDGQNRFMAERGYELHAVASSGPYLDRIAERDGVVPHAVEIARAVAPFRDVISLGQLYCLFLRIRPDIVHLSTPKAAFLGAIAATLARVPVRLFLVRGLVSASAQGVRRAIYKWSERLTARLCHRCVCVSRSLLTYARDEGILANDSGIVIANGMSNGIKLARFAIGEAGHETVGGAAVAGKIAGTTAVLGYVGRLTPEKGIADLARAWAVLREEVPDLKLLLVGTWEREHPVEDRIRAALCEDPRVVITGDVEDPAPYYRMMSVLVLPSYREGFPNAPMEAAASGIPVIASRVVGNVDAVLDGVTGKLVPVGDPEELSRAILRYICDPDLRARHGQAGFARVARDFQQERIWEGFERVYGKLLEARAQL